MLDKGNIISASVSEAAEKIPTDKKDYRKRSFICFTLYSHSIQSKSRPKYIANSTNSSLPTMIHPLYLKNH